MTGRLDQRSDKPTDDNAMKLGMRFEQVGSVAARGRNFADIGGLIPEPGRFLRGGVMHELLAGTRRGNVEQFHCILRWRVFVIVGDDEQSR